MKSSLQSFQMQRGEPSQPAQQPEQKVNLEKVKANSMDRHANKKKNLGNLQEPKQINVVKNVLFEQHQRNPIGILGEQNFDLNVITSIGSSFNQKGSITSPVAEKPKVEMFRAKRDSKEEGAKKSRTRSPILKNKSQAYRSPPNKNGNTVKIREPSPEQRKASADARNARHAEVTMSNAQKNYSLGKRPTQSKNKQIQDKFDQFDNEFPLVPGEAFQPRSRLVSGKKQPRVAQTASREKKQGSDSRNRSKGPYSLKKQKQQYSSVKPMLMNFNLKPTGAGPGPTMQKGHPIQNLQQEYYQKKERMQSRLSEEVAKNSIGKDAIRLKRVRFPWVEETDEPAQLEDDLDLIPGRERSAGARDKKPVGINEKLVDYARSGKAVQLRIENKFSKDIVNGEANKNDMMQELNHRLLELDQINEDKRHLSQMLIEKIKFVRDLQASLGTADNGEIKEIIDKEMEQAFRNEKRTNIELKELIKQERQEILGGERELQYLLGKKQVTVVNRSGNQIHLNKIAMTIDDLIKYREQVIRDCDTTSREIDAFRNSEPVTPAVIEMIQRDIERTMRERNDLNDQYCDLQARFDDMYIRNESNYRAQIQMFRKSKYKQSGRVLLNCLDKICKTHTLRHFLSIRQQQKNDYAQISSILAFRKLCYKFNDTRQRKYFQKWYINGLKPYGLKKLNKEVTKFMTKNNTKILALTRWNHLQILTQTQRSYQQQLIGQQIFSIKKLFLRQSRRAFDLWQGASKQDRSGKRHLIWFVREQMNNRKKEALQKWRDYIQHEDIQVQLNAKAIRFSVLQYKNGIFSSWRYQTAILKRRRIGRLIRAFKILNKNRQLNKLRRLQIMNVMKYSNTIQSDLVMKIFNELRVHKEREKLQLLTETRDATIEAISTAQSSTSDIKDKRAVKQSRRAVKLGLINPFGKLLMQYFSHWKTLTDEHKITLMKKIKIQIIKVYQSKIRDGFDKLKQKGQAKTKKKKMMMNMEMESSVLTQQDEVEKVTEQIKQQEVRSMNTGKTKTRKLMLRAYTKNLKLWFLYWKSKVDTQKADSKKLDKAVLSKWRKRLQRQGLEKFKNKINSLKRIEAAERKSENLIERFHTKSLRKFFNALLVSKKHNEICQKQFRVVLERNYFLNMKDYWMKWQKYKNSENNKKAKKKMAIMEEEISETQALQNDDNDVLFQQQQVNKEMVRSQQSLGRKVMKKTISGWRNYRYQWAFQIWKESSDHFKAQKKGLNTAFMQKLNHRLFHNAFSLWRKNMHLITEKKRLLSQQVELQDSKKATEQMESNKTRIAQKRERKTHELEKLKEAQKQKYQLIRNHIFRQIKDKDNNFIISRKEHIFQSWRNISRNNTYVLNRLASLMKNNYSSIGFHCLKDANYLYDRRKRNQNACKHTFGRFEKNILNNIFSLWKANMMRMANQKTENTKKNTIHLAKNHEIAKSSLQDKRSSLYLFNYDRNLVKECFIALFDYRAKKITQRMKATAFRQKQEMIWQRNRVQKWVLRSDNAIIFRQKVKCLKKYRIEKLYKFQVFKVLKKNFQQMKLLRTKLGRIHTNIKAFTLRDAFDNIKQKRDIVILIRKNLKVRSQCKMADFASKYGFKNLKKYFDKFYFNGIKKYQKNERLKTIIHLKLTRFYREAFEKWKENAEMMEVIKFNNEEGPIAIELINRKQELKNLAFMIMDKMINNQAEINGHIKKDDEKTQMLLNKTRIRNRLFGDGNDRVSDDWLKAYCFDRFKKSTHDRKLVKRSVKMMEMLYGNDPLNRTALAFYRWKNRMKSQLKYLNGLTQEELMDLDHRQSMMLREMAEKLQSANEEITDLQGQRDYLVDKVVIGQRLALARCRMSFSMAKEKAFNRFYCFTVCCWREEAENEIRRTVDEIEYLKQRMLEIEQENTDIADQNEGLKEGAKEGVNNLEQMEEVEEEVETANELLIQQAYQIKELIGENQRLQEELADYE